MLRSSVTTSNLVELELHPPPGRPKTLSVFVAGNHCAQRLAPVSKLLRGRFCYCYEYFIQTV